jgi:hypothetical protein
VQGTKYCTYTFDASGAFLEANNDYTNYAWLPAVFFGKRFRVVLKKALHCEKLTGKLWNDLCNNILIGMGWGCTLSLHI